MAPTPQKIVFVMSQYSVGGAETQLAALIERRPERARHIELHTITLIPTQSAEIEARYRDQGVINHLVDRTSLSFPVFFGRLLSTMRRIDPDLVHTLLDSSPGAWGRLAAWMTRVPKIIHSDLLLAVEGTRAHLLLRPYLDRVTTRFLPNAEAIADRLVRDGVIKERIRVLPNGVDLDRFRLRPPTEARAAWGIPEDAVVAGFVGRFADQKRIDLLLAAVLRLQEAERPDVILLAGDGPNMPSIRRTIEDDPWLSQHCRLLGIIHDIPEFMSGIDYLVITSDSEGLPNVLMEAMAMARPVLSTRVSDIPIRLGEAGVLADPGDVASIAAAFREMQALGPERRRQKGLHARARIEEQHDMTHIAQLFWDAHLELLPAPPLVRSGTT